MKDDDHWGPPSEEVHQRAPKAKLKRPVPPRDDGWHSDTGPVAAKPRPSLRVGPRTQAATYVCMGVTAWLMVGLAFLGRASGDETDTRPDPRPIRAVVPAVDGPDGVVAETCRRYDLPTDLCDLSERCVGAEGFQANSGRVTLVLRSSELSCARNLSLPSRGG